ELARGSEKTVAWGEIGLDYYYDHSPRDVQRDVFRRQTRLAKELELPIIVHSRDANDDTVEILKEENSLQAKANGLELTANSFGAEKNSRKPLALSHKPGVMHCFGGTPEMALALIEVGFYISFAGNVTFKKAEELREAARVVPLDRLLVETDCPFLTPVPHRGKRNEPAMVVHTAVFLAELKGVDFDVLARQTSENFSRLFGVDLSILAS
ncbi:MAG TPA: TatD family hydrolase, partial [Pyrinomonadaceae bacterium]|nr:TatD family hydrolase [Pyrinomonadaceae bacterium]